MRTFAPRQFFLRVGDKFVPDFVDHDPALKSGPCLLYIRLFARCGNRDHCTLSQKELAKLCKCSVRSIQNHVRALVALEYIHVEHGDIRDVNIYTLLLSPRVISLLQKAGVETLSSAKPSLRVTGEKSAPSLRDLRNQDTPLSPLPKPAPAVASPTASVPSSPCRSNSMGNGFPSHADKTGRGDSFSANEEKKTHSTVASDFEQLWAAWPASAAWPMPRNRRLALRMFRLLAKELPDIEALLAVVERFKASDSRWKNGYPPELSNWLRGRGWQKEPLVREKSSASVPKLTTEQRRLQDEQHSRLCELQKQYATPLFSGDALPEPLQRLCDGLCALWPGDQQSAVHAYFGYLAASGTTPHAGLLDRGRTYLAETSSPGSLLVWLRHNISPVNKHPVGV